MLYDAVFQTPRYAVHLPRQERYLGTALSKTTIQELRDFLSLLVVIPLLGAEVWNLIGDYFNAFYFPSLVFFVIATFTSRFALFSTAWVVHTITLVTMGADPVVYAVFFVCATVHKNTLDISWWKTASYSQLFGCLFRGWALSGFYSILFLALEWRAKL